eukprot:78607_1
MDIVYEVRVSLRCGPSCDASSVRRTKPKTQLQTYSMTSILILRSLAFVYLIAFSVAYFQNKALIGTNGIYPYTQALEQHSSDHTSYWDIHSVILPYLHRSGSLLTTQRLTAVFFVQLNEAYQITVLLPMVVFMVRDFGIESEL